MVEEKKDVVVRVSYETRKKLKIEASKKDMSIKVLIEKLINEHLENGMQNV